MRFSSLQAAQQSNRAPSGTTKFRAILPHCPRHCLSVFVKILFALVNHRWPASQRQIESHLVRFAMAAAWEHGGAVGGWKCRVCAFRNSEFMPCKYRVKLVRVGDRGTRADIACHHANPPRQPCPRRTPHHIMARALWFLRLRVLQCREGQGPPEAAFRAWSGWQGGQLRGREGSRHPATAV